MRRRPGYLAVLAAWLSLAACATGPLPAPQEARTRSTNGDQRMLVPEGDGGGAGKVERYTLAPLEVFRMPQPQAADNPELAVDSPRQALAPTTACVLVVVDAQGGVQRAEPLNDRSDGDAGTRPENADLSQASLDKVRQWRFQPAAICHFAPDRPPRDNQSCEGAQTLEPVPVPVPVPVTLQFAFTFQVRLGHGQVRAGRLGH